jgi:hypothetical protein
MLKKGFFAEAKPQRRCWHHVIALLPLSAALLIRAAGASILRCHDASQRCQRDADAPCAARAARARHFHYLIYCSGRLFSSFSSPSIFIIAFPMPFDIFITFRQFSPPPLLLTDWLRYAAIIFIFASC